MLAWKTRGSMSGSARKVSISSSLAPLFTQCRSYKHLHGVLLGALLKNEQDVTLFEKLVFMQRHNR